MTIEQLTKQLWTSQMLLQLEASFISQIIAVMMIKLPQLASWLFKTLLAQFGCKTVHVVAQSRV